MFRYTYAGIRRIKIHMEKENRYTNRVMRTSIGTVAYVCVYIYIYIYIYVYLVLNPHNLRANYIRNSHGGAVINKPRWLEATPASPYRGNE